MRCYQHIGLKPEAEKFLKDNVKQIPDITCSKCGEVLTYKLNIISEEIEDLFYSDGPILHTYGLKDGRKIKEVVQASPLSSGPMGFLCLEIENERLFTWSDEEINERM